MKLALLAVVGCGSARPAPTIANEVLPGVDPGGLEVRVVYEGAWENGPHYRFTIHRDGAIDWDGTSNVKTLGLHHRQAERRDLDHLEPALELARFWERDPDARLPGPAGPDCDDASHVIIEARRGATVHKVDFTDGCTRDPAMAQLVELLDNIAGSAAWR